MFITMYCVNKFIIYYFNLNQQILPSSDIFAKACVMLMHIENEKKNFESKMEL